jgi:hydroxyacylglutathione hydrolase
MLASLTSLTQLPGNTRVCCTHEYTVSNLRFARTIEPDNEALADYERRCLKLRAENHITLPSSIALERQINPFLRSHEPSVARAVMAHNSASCMSAGVFATLREWKNNFK